MMVGSADLLIIAAMLSLKTQMAMKQTASTGRRRKAGPRQPDEFELIMCVPLAHPLSPSVLHRRSPLL